MKMFAKCFHFVVYIMRVFDSITTSANSRERQLVCQEISFVIHLVRVNYCILWNCEWKKKKFEKLSKSLEKPDCH